jgi:predicted nuclease with TOPRIM domain
MKDYPNARDCEHGQLRRACPICEAEHMREENAELRGRLLATMEDLKALIKENYALQEAVRKMLAADGKGKWDAKAYFDARAAVGAMVGEG